MIEIIPDMPDKVIGFTAKGKITGEDYESVLIPAVEQKLKDRSKINFLYYIGPDYGGFEAKAMWDDAKLGLKHFKAWQKVAVVSDVHWIRWAIRIFGVTMPGHIKVFSNDKLAEARHWVCA